MAASTATPTLHKCIEKGIRKTILASSKTPIQSCLAEHGLSDRLSRASDAELERYDKLGQLGLYICFIHTLFLEPVGERPAVQDRVLSRETLALVMQNADVDCTSTNTNVLVEALQIFVGALFRKKDLTTVLFWFRGVFLPIVAAADTARNKVAPHDTAKDISKQGHLEPTKRFGQAQTLLTTQRTVKDSLPPPVDAPRKPDVVGVAPSSQTELETRTFTGAVREAIVAATAVVKQEFGDFSNAAFPLGFLTFMAEAPTAFVTGLASALGTDASNNRKRKLISDSTESDVASASTSASASASVSVSASATSTSADPLPPPRKKCHPPSVRARVPLAASTADALSPAPQNA